MCSIIVFFSAVLAAAEGTGAFDVISDTFGLTQNGKCLFRSAFEITNISGLGQNAVGTLPIAAVICCFGSLSVILQLVAAAGNQFSLKLSLVWFPVKAGLVFLFSKLYIWIFLDNAVPAFSRSEEIIVELDNFIPSLCLIMMIFILVFQKRLDFLKRV